MSPATDNFIHSLVEMSKAFETLPTVQAELSEARDIINQREATIQRLELKLMDRNTEIETLNAKLRDAEVARDDAELRFLESEDRTGRILMALSEASAGIGLAMETLKPPKVDEPVHIDPFANEPPAQGQSEPGPTSAASMEASAASVSTVPIELDTVQSPLPEAMPDPGPAIGEGVSVPPNPTALSTAGDGPSPETATAIPNAETGAGASSGRSPTDREWAGMTWSHARATLAYVPYDKREWLEGGGREEDYYL